MKIFAEDALHDFLFPRAQQTVVDENAGELVADGFVQKRGHDGGIDPTAESEDDLRVADLRCVSFSCRRFSRSSACSMTKSSSRSASAGLSASQ